MRAAITPRVRVVEPLHGALMVTVYEAKRPGEVGHVGLIPDGGTVWHPTRPGGSASS